MKHWPEYLMEALGLGLFMVSACAFGALLGHPASPVKQALPDPFTRRRVEIRAPVEGFCREYGFDIPKL